MLIKRYIKGIAFVSLILSIAWIVMAAPPVITGPSPSSPVSDTVDAPRTFSFNSDQKVNVTWYINGTQVHFNENITAANYPNASAVLGTWNVSAIAVATNITNGTAPILKWDWIVTAPLGTPAIIGHAPPSPVSDSASAARTFNITVNQTVDVTWFINGTQVFNQAGVSTSTYNNASAVEGTWNVSAIATNSTTGAASQIWDWNVAAAPTPPANVANLTLTGNGTTWLLINWTNPVDPNFHHVMVLINGTLKGNTTSNTTNSFNITSLSSATTYVITVKSVDAAGNINQTGTTLTATTDPNTPASPNPVTVPLQNSTVTFTSVTTTGNTVEASNTSHSLPAGHTPVGNFIDISTTAVITPPITVRVKYNPALLSSGYIESDIRLYHWNDSTFQWDNVTTSVDTVNKMVIGTVPGLSPFVAGVPPKPIITKVSPADPVPPTIVNTPQTFQITVSQDANVTWQIGTFSQANQSIVGVPVNLTFTPASPGNFTVSVTATNANGSSTASWNWTVHPRTFFTGNRVWDSTKDMSLIYTWNPMSFYAFYYDVDSNVGNESLTIHLDSTLDRNIQRGSLQYSTTPDSVSFQQSKWGKYSVIGFMADKYFAGYTSDTSRDITSNPVSPLNSNQLHKILMDDDTQRVVSAGSTLTLQEGYVIKIKDVDATGRIVLLSLLKDGGEVDIQPVSQGGTYVYSKRVGTVVDLPIIAVRVENVFSGTETSAAFTKGIFQLSESFTSANTGNRYGVMEITGASASGITMENRDSITLSQGSTIDIMGDIKFIVADNSSVLRFAPMVKRSGTYEVRGTIVQPNDTNPFEWTPMNFEGFYYNLNDDVGTEKLSITRGGTGVSKENLIYTTTPQAVNYKFSKFGTFNVIGFMADKYFAGYIGCPTCITTKDVSTIGFQQLHKVLVDDDTQRVIYAGSTLTLNDGYVMKIKDVNIGAGTASVWLSLLKDGNEIFSDVKNEGEIFTYAPSKVGAINDLPILALRIDKIFRGTEATAAFIRGVFQISEKYTSVNQGDRFGIMEVSEVSVNQIQMTNPSSFTLSSGSTIDVMGNIKFKVADSSDVRFYPFIMANGSDIAASQLAIDAPASPMVRDTITITVTAGSETPIENAEVSFDGNVIGTTNSTGKLDYILTRSGQHTLTATKLGYDKATRTIQVSEFRDIALKFELPAVIDQGIPVAIKVISNGTAIPGANVTFNGASIGLTDSSGILTYTFSVSGTHNLGASKQRYISVLREITVRAPFTEFKAIDINFTPSVVFMNQNYFVWANITNVGTKNGTLPVPLSVNDTAVESKNVTLSPGARQEVNFTRKMTLPPGNYTVEILGQKKIMEVKEAPFNIFLIGGILTAFGAVVIYLSTTVKGKETLELLTQKFNELIASGKK